jgi:dTDP-4-amino-4,6-dideoxygalactose transaminase
MCWPIKAPWFVSLSRTSRLITRSICLHCVTNGGLGLQIMLKALDIKGEVITTPFSYVATSSCPFWEGCSIKFADIEPDHMTIDPAAVEAAIGAETERRIAGPY